MLNLSAVGSKIIQLRKQNNMTQSDLAEELFVTRQAVSKWEQGSSVPSIDIFVQLTTLFDVTIDYLLEDTEVLDDDFETLFKQLPRSVVISRFFKRSTPNKDIQKIFYLLNNDERRLIINKMIAGTINLHVEVLWPYLNPEERLIILRRILNNTIDANIYSIYNMLTTNERATVSKHQKAIPFTHQTHK